MHGHLRKWLLVAAMPEAFPQRTRWSISASYEEAVSVVIPDLEGMNDNCNGLVAIGLSGPIGVGKTTAGMHLRALGFHYARYSTVVAEVARDTGREPTRTALQEIGRQIHETLGQRWLGQKLLERLPKSGCLVIDGLRYPEDHAFLTESFGPCFRHVAITARLDIRRQRFLRSRPADDYDEAVTHPSELGVESVVQLAHRVINNAGSEEQF